MGLDTADGALVQLRAYIAQGGFSVDDRLPPERRLCGTLGVTRSELRRAFAVLEAEGAVWRHVGRGTFIGPGPRSRGGEIVSIEAIAKRTTPQEVMHARGLLEPMLCREAAVHATAEHVEALHETVTRSRLAGSWREYETLDNRFHRTIAEATRNRPLVGMFDQLNAVRRTVSWGRLRRRVDRPPPDHHSFAEHEAILAALEERDADRAERGMREHLRSVGARLFPDP